ncbi:hypothetical protein HYFRA_00008779 [Hymenoscyphus fraxineus]|uniref:Uncharacterized protein n=1 Tax=Hymenoscyphus fraxineus TaxID=746836 RepID=A0A9N9PQL7_9HELO|nr:hypothetical protein HYFRA_00008779 [Hymenoscyphus fraxineus]
MPIKLTRLLIKTHHMTSRKKISALTKAAGKYNVSVLLKVGSPPGIMLCEGVEGGRDGGKEEGGVKGWEGVVRRLRYKDIQLLEREEIPELALVRLGIREGDVLEIEEIKEFGRLLERDPGLFGWWRRGMGFVRD